MSNQTIDIDRLKNYISENGFRQKKIAEEARMEESKLSAVLHGRRRLEAGEYARICTVLKVPMELFVIRTNHSTAELRDVKTCDLVSELQTRIGVETKIAEPYQEKIISANGPAVILIVED